MYVGGQMPAVGTESLFILLCLFWKDAEAEPEIYHCHVMAEVLVEQLLLLLVARIKLGSVI